MGASHGARRAGTDDDAAEIAERSVDHEVGAALVDTAQTLVCVLDRDGRIIRFNRACERTTGWTSAEVVGRDARETVIPPEDHEAFGEMIRGMVATGAPNPQQGQWVTRDGYRRVIAWANRPLRDENGAVRYVVTSGLDITDRESAASELWALQAELHDRLEDLSRLAAEQAALRRVATLVAREPAPEAVFQLVTEEASRLLGADSGLLLCYSEDHTTGTVVGRYSEVQSTAFLLGTILPVEGDSLTSTVPRTGKAGRLDSYEGLSGEIAQRARDSHYRSVVAAPVVVAGRVWGLLVAATQREEPLPERAEHRLESFAELVALALAGADARNELAASRSRLVEAGDAARRRLERDLHDGAQQRLVAVSLQMRLARARLAKEPAAAAEILDEASVQLGQGLEQLRELARGIHPAVLTDRGLDAALGALASRAPFPVHLDVPDDRFPQPVEVAVYYLVSEALTNAAKYAEPTAVHVAVCRDASGLVAEVSDNGRGGADPTGGTGLRGLADRVEALGGRVRIDSPPGRGTRIRAELPLRDADTETATRPRPGSRAG
jgi:PAS domain S-box-containing protein